MPTEAEVAGRGFTGAGFVVDGFAAELTAGEEETAGTDEVGAREEGVDMLVGATITVRVAVATAGLLVALQDVSAAEASTSIERPIATRRMG